MGSSNSYGRAFVAPIATDCLRELGRHHSVNNNINQRFGNTDDMKNLLEDIYDIWNESKNSLTIPWFPSITPRIDLTDDGLKEPKSF